MPDTSRAHEPTVDTLFVGTVIRGAPVREGGELFRIDWRNKLIERRRAVYPDNPNVDMDTNPRGNTRGCRGIAVTGNKVIFANYHTIEIADWDLVTHRRYSDGVFVGLHEVFLEDSDNLWVSATAVDGAHCLRLSTGEISHRFWPRMHAAIQTALGIDPPEIDHQIDQRLSFLARDHTKHKSHLHLNAISRMGGRIVGLFNRFGTICDLESGDILARHDRMIKAHNIVPLSSSRCLVNDTRNGAVLTVNIEHGTLEGVIELRDYAFVRDLEKAAFAQARSMGLTGNDHAASITRPLFVRGLAVCGPSMFVGLSPATVLEMNIDSGELVDAMTLSSDPRECVHGLAKFTGGAAVQGNGAFAASAEHENRDLAGADHGGGGTADHQLADA